MCIFCGRLTVEFIFEIIFEFFLEILNEILTDKKAPIALRIIGGIFWFSIIAALIVLMVMGSVKVISENIYAGIAVTALFVFVIAMIVFALIRNFKNKM